MSRSRRAKAGVKRSTGPKSTEMKPLPASATTAQYASPTTVLRGKTPEPPKTPDFEFVKRILMAVLSQILFGRGCFHARNFQTIPFDDLETHNGFHEVVESGEQIPKFERPRLLDRTSTLMFRRSNDAKFNRFLETLTSALPLIDKKQLQKLRLPITTSKNWRGDCLVEYWTVYFSYRDDGVCGLDVWRGGTDQCDVGEDVTRSYLWQVGSYVAQLPALKRPFYLTQIFTSQARPNGLAEGWNYSAIDFDTAKLKLVQKQGYCFQKVASLYVTPREYETVTFATELDVRVEPNRGVSTVTESKDLHKTAYSDFPSTDPVEEATAGDPSETLSPRPRQNHRSQKKQFVQTEPPIEIPPSDMEETQEAVPSRSSNRLRKRSWRHDIEDETADLAIPAFKYLRTKSSASGVRVPVKDPTKTESKSTRSKQKADTQESEQKESDMASNKDNAREKAKRRLDKLHGPLEKLRSEHQKTYTDTSEKEDSKVDRN